MPVRSTERSDAVALRPPLFWAALALLVLNDHVLKGAGVLPGWLTGKLSDFAGLLVAPVLLSAMLRARTERVRAAAFVLVAGWFTAVKLVPAAAGASVALAASVGLDWTIRVDSTDLIALSVLPLAWHVASHRGPLAPRAWTERLAIGLGVAACVASPPPRPSWTTSAFLVNRTNDRAEVRVRWLEARVDCDAVREHVAEALARDAFSAGTIYALERDEVLPLDRGVVDSADPWAAPLPTGHVGTCDAAMISADGLPDAIVFWDGLVAQTVFEIDGEGSFVDGLELYENTDGTLRLDPGPGYAIAAPIDRWETASACRDYGAISGFAWSELPAWADQRVTLTEVRVGIDGCLSLTIDDSLTEHHAYLCVPPEDFPFASGNEVRIWNGPEELRILRELPRDDGTVWRVGELVVHRGGAFSEGPFDVDVVVVDAECQGVRMECGGYRVPGAGGIAMGTGVRFVHPGEAMERDDASGRRARLRVGRAETLWVTHDACGAGRDVLGSRLEALVVYGEATR